MTPSNPENDPVHKGLHDLGQQIDESEGAAGDGPSAGRSVPAGAIHGHAHGR